MIYDLDVLEDYLSRGLLIKQVHPRLPLTIWNYSRICQSDKIWDDITLNMRATVLDKEGRVVARSFPKFFNMDEHVNPIPPESFEVYEKMDGSLILLFYYQGEWVVASKGSFNSDYSKKAEEILKNHKVDYLDKHICYSFELISPLSKIVVDYGGVEKLVMLAAFNREGGEWNINEYGQYGFEIVKNYKGIDDLSTIKQKIESNHEGFVVRFKNGFRIKIKSDEYIKLHYYATGLTKRHIWEALKDGIVNQLLEVIPDEFDEKVKDYITRLKLMYESIVITNKNIVFNYAADNLDVTKKDFAEYIFKEGYSKAQCAILFAMWDNKDYSEIVWRQLYPEPGTL